MSKLNKSLVSPSLLLKIGAWRPPIFMVDRIAAFTPGEKGSITVIKHVSFNEPYISGHFPDNPVMPGVMIAEIFGQASEYLSLINDFGVRHHKETGQELKKFDDFAKALNNVEGVQRILEERKRMTGFLAAQDVKYKHAVYPGDTIEVTSSLAFADINGFHHYNVEARVGRHLASVGTIINFRMDQERALSQGMFVNL